MNADLEDEPLRVRRTLNKVSKWLRRYAEGGGPTHVEFRKQASELADECRAALGATDDVCPDCGSPARDFSDEKAAQQ